MSQKIVNDGDGNQIAQFGGDLNGTFNQVNGMRTLASLTLPELGEEYLLADSIVSRERKSRRKTSAIAALVCLLCCGITCRHVLAVWAAVSLGNRLQAGRRIETRVEYEPHASHPCDCGCFFGRRGIWQADEPKRTRGGSPGASKGSLHGGTPKGAQ